MSLKRLLLTCGLACCAAAWMPQHSRGQASAVAMPELALDSLPDAPLPSASDGRQQSDQQKSQGQQPPAGEPSLGDLGFTPAQTQSNAQLQALLDKRTHMLKMHHRMGLITTIPMAATLITGPTVAAKGKNGQPITEPSQANLDFHAALGGVTTALYVTTAFYAIFAPKVPGVEPRGAIRLHRALAFVHGPGMIATPVLGAMAFKQEQAGEKVHGIASAHGAVAWTTAVAYGVAIVSVSWPIRLHR